MSDLLSVDFLRFAIPALGAVIAWFVNERRKRGAEDYVRKEQKYEALVDSLQGFYADISDTPEGRELRRRFLAELNRCWLYCPDDVIRKAYAFLASVTSNTPSMDQVKEEALGALVVAIRRDLLTRRPTRSTKFRPVDFKHLKTPDRKQ